MKLCILCLKDKEDTSVTQVVPATWNGFSNYAEVCTECQDSRRFKSSNRSRKPAAAPAVPAAAPLGASAAPAGSRVEITHRRTGSLLQTLPGTSLARASLREAALSGADLQHAAMREADLLRADLHLADLSGADLRGADLRGANLRGCDLRGTNLGEARLYRADLRHAVYDSGTRWPGDFDPLTSGAQKVARHG